MSANAFEIKQSQRGAYGPAITGRHWIDGKLVGGSKTFESKNPSDLDDIVGRFPQASDEEVKLAVEAANRCFQKWRATPAPIRGNAIGRLARVLEREKDHLAWIITREIGKPIKESKGEVQEAIDTAQFFQSEGRRLYGMTTPSELPQKELMTYRRPLGSCLMITACNFPFAVPSWKIIPALLCGNTVVWKASQDVPCTALAFALCFEEAGFPSGSLNLIFGDGSVGQKCLKWVEEGKLQKVSFTGSMEVGKKIGEICGRSLQSPSLELGGKNPLIIDSNANLDKAISTSIISTYGTAGQRCTSTGNIIVHKDIYHEFKKRFINEVKKIPIGNPYHETSVLYGPLFAKRYLDRFLEHLQWGQQEAGANLLLGQGQISKQNPWPHFFGDADKGWYVAPTLWEVNSTDNRLFQEEIFGPTVNLIQADSFEQALEMANAHPYGLSSALFSESPLNILTFKENIEAGMSSVNNSTTGAEAHLPFGGIKHSGNGARENGVWVLDSYTRWHTVNMDLAPDLQLAQMDVDYGGFKEPTSFRDWTNATP